MLSLLKSWRRRAARRIHEKIADPWGGSGDTYVSLFKDKLDSAAEALSGQEVFVRTRFNQERGCAELYDQNGVVLAQVRVNGSECSPMTAIITPPPSTSEAARGIIAGAFYVPAEFQLLPAA